jgi:hypothetical protein
MLLLDAIRSSKAICWAAGVANLLLPTEAFAVVGYRVWVICMVHYVRLIN